MGKVIERDLPKDHPIFTTGWSVNTVKRPKKSDKPSQKNTAGTKDKKK